MVQTRTRKFASEIYWPLIHGFILGEDYIVEAAPSDEIWGVGMDKTNKNISIPALWKGTNILGWALMEARDKFKTTEKKCQSW